MDALVVGSAACVWDDLRALGPWSGIVIAVNHAAVGYPHRIDHLATLHGEWVDGWRREREEKGGNTDFAAWTRPDHEGGDRTLSGWSSGSSGLFGVGVALELGASRVVLAGVPIDVRPHFFDAEPWTCFSDYRGVWEGRADRLRGRVYSMSGWTRDLLGAPPWIHREEVA